MNGDTSTSGGNGLDKDFAKGMGGGELIELMHLGVPEVAEAIGISYPELARVVRCGACADAEPAVHGHLLGVVESAMEAMEGVAGEIANNRLAHGRSRRGRRTRRDRLPPSSTSPAAAPKSPQSLRPCSTSRQIRWRAPPSTWTP